MDQDLIYFDDDPRNARVRVVRHPAARPGYPMPVRPPMAAPVYPPAAYPVAPAMYPAAPAMYGPAPVLVQRPRRFATDLSTGEIASLAAQALAALQSLPAAPAPVGATETDVANLIAYQSALAAHAKRDEQLRTIGSFLAKLLG